MRVVACCAYFHDSCIDAAASHLVAAGLELHLWALDRPRPALQPITRGQGLLPKWPIMSALMARVETDFDYVVFFDDDIILPPGFWTEYLAEVRACGAELSQPALTPGSYVSHAITRQDPSCRARITNFVEIGPFVCMTNRFYQLVLPFFDPISPLGWGYAVQWTHVAKTHGLAQAIIDRCAVRHARPVGVNYSTAAARHQMQSYLRKYGLPKPVHTTYTYLR
jgi:hypothetical protein